MARWTDEERATAVLMLEAAGYPERKGALTHVADNLHIPATTLRRWHLGINNPPPAETVKKKRVDLRNALRDEIQAAFQEMGSARADASYRDLGTVLGILFDKLQLLNGDSTANTNQRISIEYIDDADIVAEAATVAERRYQAGGEV